MSDTTHFHTAERDVPVPATRQPLFAEETLAIDRGAVPSHAKERRWGDRLHHLSWDVLRKPEPHSNEEHAQKDVLNS